MTFSTPGFAGLYGLSYCPDYVLNAPTIQYWSQNKTLNECGVLNGSVASWTAVYDLNIKRFDGCLVIPEWGNLIL